MVRSALAWSKFSESGKNETQNENFALHVGIEYSGNAPFFRIFDSASGSQNETGPENAMD